MNGVKRTASALAHDDVLALPDDRESGFLQSANRVEMIDAGNLRH